MRVTGRTRLYGIIADPVSHLRTPQALNAQFVRYGFDGILVPMHVTADDLAAAWQGLWRLRNLHGVIVTVPHKTAVLVHCDEASEAARQAGAANAVRRTEGGRMVCDMFDGKGFVEGLRSQGIDPRGMDVLLVGAGGAASAIAFALAAAGCPRLTIANRTASTAVALAARVARAYPACAASAGPADPAGHDLVVNGTSLGLRPDDPLPVDVAQLAPGMIVAEAVMAPEITPLLAAARLAGCRVHLGRHMLEAQLPLLADFLASAAAAPAHGLASSA